MSGDTPFEWLTLTEGESVLWSGQPRKTSVLGMVVLVVVGLAVLAGLVVAEVVGPLFLALGAVVGVLLIGWTYVWLANIEYVLTDRNVYRKAGVLGRSVERADLGKVQNTDLKKGVLGVVFGYGSIKISTAGTSGAEVTIRSVRDPEEPQELLNRYTKQTAGTGMDAMGRGADPESVERLLREARKLREVAESLEETFTGPR